MCQRCSHPPATVPKSATCSRCGYEGTCWLIEAPRWPSWRIERICFICIAHAHLAAA